MGLHLKKSATVFFLFKITFGLNQNIDWPSSKDTKDLSVFRGKGDEATLGKTWFPTIPFFQQTFEQPLLKHSVG